MINVLYLANIPSPYRVDFFNEIGIACKLTVLFESNTAKDREQLWLSNSFDKFDAYYLNGIKFRGGNKLSFEVLKYLKSEKYDLIIVGGYSTPTGMLAVSYLRFKKKYFILNVDGGLIRKDSMIKFLLKRFFISSPNAWLSSGPKTNEYLKHYGAVEGHIYTYPFSSFRSGYIIKSIISPLEKKVLRDKLNIYEKKVIVTVGQFIPRKGFRLLMEAATMLDRSIGIYFIGGKPTNEYIYLKNRFDLNNVHFIDFKTKDELQEYYKSADLFVLPTKEDIWGLVVNEAMANGLPIITTNKCVAGLELVKDYENGFIIPVDEYQTLANKINEIIYDEDILENMSRKSLEIIKGYTIETMAKKHLDIFNYILMEKDN